jgi:hypothetical protein
MMTAPRWKKASFLWRSSLHRLPVPVRAESSGMNKATEKINDDVGASFYSISVFFCSAETYYAG